MECPRCKDGRFCEECLEFWRGQVMLMEGLPGGGGVKEVEIGEYKHIKLPRLGED
jgi:hypothetical protein